MSAPASRSQDPSSRPNLIAFLHATVIPMDTERVLRDQTVVTANGKIVEIGPASAVKPPVGALCVDAKGRYLLPALCDMHVHLLGEAWNMMLRPEARLAGKNIPFESFFFPYIASGVTTVQALSATPEEVTLRGRIDRGELLGPRLVLARMIDGPKKAWPPPLSTWVASAEEAREAVRRAKDEGYDKIKVYSFLSKECYDAIVSTAKELRMDVIGHVPMSLSVEYVLDAGQKLIAHSEEVAKHARGEYDAERIGYFAAKMAERGVWMMPTLVTTRSILGFFDAPDSLLAGPEAGYFRHPMLTGVWSFMTANLYGPIPAETRNRLREDFERFQKPLTRAFHEKGGKLVAGSDALMIGLFPGLALHRELKELVDIGLTPFEALRTSTTSPFEYLGEGDLAGTIQVGKRSDLLLLDENPLEDVSAASKIAGVLIRGRWIGSQEIRRTMQKIAASYEAPAERSR
jgi:imidazolonepropionase-like amidohydrolase